MKRDLEDDPWILVCRSCGKEEEIPIIGSRWEVETDVEEYEEALGWINGECKECQKKR